MLQSSLKNRSIMRINSFLQMMVIHFGMPYQCAKYITTFQLLISFTSWLMLIKQCFNLLSI